MEASIYQILDYKDGTSSKGFWQRITYLVKADKIMLLTSWGGDCELIKKLTINDRITFDLEISAREYNGKWYNDVTARNVVGDESNDMPPLREQALNRMDEKAQEVTQGSLDLGTEDIESDLPF